MADQTTVKDRKRRIIEILKSAEYMTLADIGKALASDEGSEEPVKKGAVNKYIESLRDEGYIIESLKNKGLRLIQDETMYMDTPDKEYELPDKGVITRWLILFLLSRYKGYMTYEMIKEGFDEKYYEIKDSVLRKHLEELTNLQYITEHGVDDIPGYYKYDNSQNKIYYCITEAAPVPAFLEMDDIFNFNDYFSFGGGKRELGGEIESIIKKIKKVIPDLDNEHKAYEAKGRKNFLTPETKEKLDRFLKLPFKTDVLNVKYPVEGEMRDIIFHTGLLVFCVEKNKFYLLGESDDEIRILRLDKITEVEVKEKSANKVYETVKYRNMFEEAWAVSKNEPEEVEIWFEDIGHVREKMERLMKRRSATAAIVGKEEAAGKNWLVYRDTIIGVTDFLPFIRSLGSSAVLVKPEWASRLIMEKTKELVDKYEEKKSI